MKSPHRKNLKRFEVAGHAHLLTFSCYQRLPLLNDDAFKGLLSQALDRALEKHSFDLIAFVYMPEHVHLLVYPHSETYSIAALLFAIKRPFSFRVKQALGEARNPLLNKLTIQDRPGNISFRFWQEGGGHDRNLISVQNCVRAAEYIHNNPVRRRLCRTPDEWKWSSWKFYHAPQAYAHPVLPHVHGFPG